MTTRPKAQLQLAPRRAAGYIRVSQVGDRAGDAFLSPEVQREKIEAWATYRETKVVEWYVDLDVSGRTGVRRPEFERLMDDAKHGRFETVAVYRLTRFGRSVQDAARRYSELRAAGVELVSVTEDIDTSTASGSFLQNILFAMAEFESERIGEEWRNVHANRRRRGIAHAPSGVYGYITEGSEPVTIEDAEAIAVRLAYDLRSKGAGLREIQVALAENGFRSPRGRTQFPKTTLWSMLTNPVYAGLVKQPDGTLLEGRHPAIVTRAQWDHVQAITRRVNTFARHTGVSLLGGLLVCHECGYRMRFESSRAGTKARYRCQHNDMGETCPHPVQVQAHRVDDFVDKAFLRRFDPKRMPNRGRVSAGQRQKEWGQKAGRLRARVEELDRALDELADQRYVKGSLAESEYHRQFARFAEERQRVQDEAIEFERMAALAKPVERDVLSLWPNAPLEVKRRVLRGQIDSIIVSPYQGERGRERYQSVGHRLRIQWAA